MRKGNFVHQRFSCFRHWDTQICKFSEAYLLISKQLTFCPPKSDENRKISKLRDAIVVFADLIKIELGKNEQRSKFLVEAVKLMRQENDVSSKALQDKLEVMNNSPRKKVIVHRFEPTSKYVLRSLVVRSCLLSSPFGAISPNGESIKIGRRQS